MILNPSLVLLLSACLLAISATPSESYNLDNLPPVVDPSEYENLTPKQAYENALSLWRSTLRIHPPTKPSSASKPATATATKNPVQDATNQPSQKPRRPLSLLWDLLTQSTPLGSIWRLLVLFWSKCCSSSPTYLAEKIPPHVPEPSTQTKWYGPPIGVSTVDDLMWPGARSAALWPDWEQPGDGLIPEDSPWDAVMFGPFWALWEFDSEESTLDANLKYNGDEAYRKLQNFGLSERTINLLASGWRQHIFSVFNSSYKDTLWSQRVEMERRRSKAVEFLEWAGWGRTNVDWYYEAYNNNPSSDPHSLLQNTFHSAANQSVSQPAFADALWVLAEHSLWGTHGSQPNIARARACYQRLVDYGHDEFGLSKAGNASAHARLAFLEGSGWESTVLRQWEPLSDDPPWHQRRDAYDRLKRQDGLRQAKAILHYTLAAEAGDPASQMALGYRYKAGIGVKPSCAKALGWYESAANHAYHRFSQGPPGGLNLPYTKLRLSDLAGGVYGAGASVASTGWAAYKPAVQAALNQQPGKASDPSSLDDMLEYYVYHAEHGEPFYLLLLAKVFYQGSIWAPSESAGLVKRNYGRALEYLYRITSQVWPKDAGIVGRGGPTGFLAKKGDQGEDVRHTVEDKVFGQAGLAASMVGRMYLRGEGVKQDFTRAWVWFQRGKDAGSREAYNGLGLMYREGLGVPKDIGQAATHFEKAAKGLSSEGCLNLAKIFIEMDEPANALKYLNLAIQQGNDFEAYFWTATINARLARQENSAERCHLALAGFKQVAERGDWATPTFHKAERAYRRGNAHKSLLGWTMASDMGFEAAQNNVAYMLDRDTSWLKKKSFPIQNNSTDRLALIHWTRSAGQDNVDAMVKMGDYYYHGIGTSTPSRPTFTKAAVCYAAAADRGVSALAYWNMGWMYENGIGVDRQHFHLAKQFYDMALKINKEEAYFAITLSLIKLHIRALFAAVFRSESSSSAISLFSSYTSSAETQHAFTEADEIAQRNQKRIQDERRQQLQLDELEAAQQGNNGMGDHNEPETWQSTDNDSDEDLDAIIEGGLLIVALGTLAYLAYIRQGVQLRLEREQREQQQQQQENGQAQPDPWLPEGDAANALAGL